MGTVHIRELGTATTLRCALGLQSNGYQRLFARASARHEPSVKPSRFAECCASVPIRAAEEVQVLHERVSILRTATTSPAHFLALPISWTRRRLSSLSGPLGYSTRPYPTSDVLSCRPAQLQRPLESEKTIFSPNTTRTLAHAPPSRREELRPMKHSSQSNKADELGKEM